MAKPFSKLQRIDNNEPVLEETHYAFLFHLQNALLLALHERGRLNALQHRYAQEKLKQHRKERAKHILDKGEPL